MDYKNQHWIQQSYLKAWCDPDKRDKIVHVYSADGSYQRWRAYSRIFSSDDLYTVMNENIRDIRTEKRFKPIEDKFLKVREMLKRQVALPPNTKRTLALFIAAMRNRSPAARDQWQSFKDRVVEVGSSMALDLENAKPTECNHMARASPASAAGRSNSMTLGEAKVAAAEPFGKWVLRHVEIESRHLEKMSFVILRAPEGIGFITSDNPVVWHDAAPLGQRRRNLGLGHPSIEVSMPLSPRFCVVFDHAGMDGICDVSQDVVDMINSRTLGHCHTCFIAQSDGIVVDWDRTFV